MKTCAPEAGESASLQQASINLRHAQRAFAALLETNRRVGEFRSAQLRSVARRTLSALSADDRALLADWLALQLVAASHDIGESALGLVARVDMRLVERVRRALPERVEALAICGRQSHFVAA